LYEFYGPHVDQLLFHEYATTDSMWLGMQLGEIDVCDWPLTSTWQNTFSAEPYLSNITMISAGGEAGYYQVDFNHNYHPTMGQILDAQGNTIPPYGVDDPNGRLNPVYINHTTSYPTYTTPQWWCENETGYLTNYNVTGIIPEGATPPGDFPPISASYNFRWAVDSLFNRTQYEQQIGLAYIPILTPIPSYMGKYSEGGYIWDACPGYQYNRTTAESYFAAAKIKCDAGSGWQRYWDLNGDGVAQQIEIAACKLVFTYRMDLARYAAGIMLTNALLAENFTFIPILSGVKSSGANYVQCMLAKCYEMTTFGWIYVGPDPDYLHDTYCIDGYWDDPESSCPNTADVNDTVLNDLGAMIKFNLTSEGARQSTIEFQKRFWFMNHALPLCSTNRVMAQAKWYTGGNNGMLTGDVEDPYRRNGTTNNDPKRAWLDFCNEQGIGSNSWFTMLNGYPAGCLYGNGNMTLRYGWSTDTMPDHINPLYSDSYWDNILLGEIYNTLGYRDPYAKGTWKGNLAESWQAGSWYDSVSKTTKSKVTVTIRTDAKWQDGMPVTLADVIYSLTEAGRDCVAKGYAPPWWWPTGSQVKSLSIIDAYTVEILYNVQSYLVEGWTLGFYIIPKHIWKPIIDTATPNPPSAFAPDPNLIGSGPYRYAAETYGTSILLVANKPGSTVKTDLSDSASVTSPGYSGYDPIQVSTTVSGNLDGVKNSITFAGLQVDDSDPTNPPHSCSVQQNFYMKCCNGSVFFVQNVYSLKYTGDPPNNQLQVRQSCEIYKYDEAQKGYDKTPVIEQKFGPDFQNVAKNTAMDLNTYIASSEMSMSGLQATKSGSDTVVSSFTCAASIIEDPYDPTVHPYSNKEDTRPQLVLVGYGGSSTATFGAGTSGSVDSWTRTGGAGWVKASPQAVDNSQTRSAEASNNLKWSSTGFVYSAGSSQAGISFSTGSSGGKKIVPHSIGVKPPLPWNFPVDVGVLVRGLCYVSQLQFSLFVYVDNVLQPGYPMDITLPPYEQQVQSFILVLQRGTHTIMTAVHVGGPSMLDNGQPNPWISQWVNVTTYVSVTILEDIGGTTYYDLIGLGSYPYKKELPMPDCKVRVDDILACATAFGSNPGDPRWDSTCDINHDYKVRVDDVLGVALEFGAG
jgi:hypothetical protein